MDKFLALFCFLVGIAIVIITYPDGNAAIVVSLIPSAIILYLIRDNLPKDWQFVSRVFVIALLARLAFGVYIHTFEMRGFFGGDAISYSDYGNLLMESWFGNSINELSDPALTRRMEGVGWGMIYLVGAIYSFVGKNIFAAQCFCAVIGAAISPILYFIAIKIFGNVRLSRTAAILAAFSPAFIIWTGQLLKDGLMIFLIVLAFAMVIRLQERFSVTSVAILMVALGGVLSLRFYVFYMIVASIFGTFLVGMGASTTSMLRRLIVTIILGLGLMYLGVLRNAGSDFERYGSLEKIQVSRGGLATANSGFAKDVDVSTTEGAFSAIPIGLFYLYFAPFPWQLASLRQSITLPDVLLWYSLIPFLVMGLIYSIKNKLRPSLGILIFSIMLSISYSLFQGNVGTAYRQRCQIQVFLFVFIAAGWTLFQEKRENKKALRNAEILRFDNQLRKNAGRSITR